MINISRLAVTFRRFALQDINLTVDDGDYFMMVGPTGAGKTLLLETIAGLHRVKAGRISIDGREVTMLEPEKRNIGMVHQDGILFPHLSVAENIVFGLKARHMPQSQVRKELTEVAGLVNIGHLLDRKPEKLSGGEKQKVALARALAIRPGLLLLDEPLSALDPGTREGLQQELKRIHRQLNITAIHVTHDFDEAMMLGKHIAVIGEGRIRQVGTPEEIFHQPDSEFVARFTMMRNILTGEIEKQGGGLSLFRSGNLVWVVNSRKEGASHACIRPDDVVLSPDVSSPATPNNITGNVVRIEDRGTAFQVFVDGPPEICCLVGRRRFSEMSLNIGQEVRITLPPDAIHVF